MDYDDPKKLMEEIDYAIAERDKKLYGVDESIARYQGPDRGGATSHSSSPENTEFEFVSYMNTQLSHGRPQVTVETPMLSKQNDAMALEVALNRWIRDTKMQQEMALAVPDFCFAWAVYVVTERPAPEMGEVKYLDGNGKTMRGIANRPYAKRIPFRLAFRDPLATSPWDMKYAGHAEITTKKNLQKIAKQEPKRWFADKIDAMATDADLMRAGRKSNIGNPSRDEVVVYHKWCADVDIDWDEYGDIPEKDRHLYHGVWYRIAPAIEDNTPTAQLLGPPEPAFCPRWGPYTFIGANIVPDDPFFMSPIQPARSSITMLNAVNDTADRSMEHYKRFIVAGGGDEDLADRVRDARHDHVFDSSGFEKGNIEAFEVGGVTNQMAVHLAMMRDRVDRKLGLSEVQRGIATGDASATENVLATQAASARMAGMERQWDYGHSQLFLTVSWYFWNSDRVAQPVSYQEFRKIGGEYSDLLAKDENGQPVIVKGEQKIDQPVVNGGPYPGTDAKEHADMFDSLDLEVLAYSRKFTSEVTLQQNFMVMSNFAFQAAAIAGTPMGAVVDWNFLCRQGERATGIYGMRNLINLQAAAMLAQSQALATYAEQSATDGPKMSKDAGGQAAQAGPKRMPDGAAGGGGRQNSPQAAPKGMPGRSAGGVSGNAASKKAGAA